MARSEAGRAGRSPSSRHGRRSRLAAGCLRSPSCNSCPWPMSSSTPTRSRKSSRSSRRVSSRASATGFAIPGPSVPPARYSSSLWSRACRWWLSSTRPFRAAQKPTQFGYVAALLGLAIGVGYVSACVRGSDGGKWALGKIGYHIQPEGTIYSQTLYHMSDDATVLVELNDGRRIWACPRNGPFYKDDGISELYLLYPKCEDADGHWQPVGGPGMVYVHCPRSAPSCCSRSPRERHQKCCLRMRRSSRKCGRESKPSPASSSWAAIASCSLLARRGRNRRLTQTPRLAVPAPGCAGANVTSPVLRKRPSTAAPHRNGHRPVRSARCSKASASPTSAGPASHSAAALREEQSSRALNDWAAVPDGCVSLCSPRQITDWYCRTAGVTCPAGLAARRAKRDGRAERRRPYEAGRETRRLMISHSPPVICREGRTDELVGVVGYAR